MKIVFFSLIASLILVGCGGKSGSGTSPERSFDPLTPSKVVSYQTGCQVDTETYEDGSRQSVAMNKILKIREDEAGNPSIAYHTISYGSADCKTAYIETKRIASGSLKEEGKLFEGSFVSATHRILRQEFVDSLNEMKACGIENWILNKEVSIFETDCFHPKELSVEFEDEFDETQPVIEVTYCEKGTITGSCFHTTLYKI